MHTIEDIYAWLAGAAIVAEAGLAGFALAEIRHRLRNRRLARDFARPVTEGLKVTARH